jgi:hypothetical protein
VRWLAVREKERTKLMLSSSVVRSAVLFSYAAGLSACFITSHHEPVIVGPDVGTLTIDVTLDGTKDPIACADYGATDIELVVYDSRGTEVAEDYAPCEDFAISVDLHDGVYSADVTLVDAANKAVTTTLPIDDVDVRAGKELVIDVDFPKGSRL